MKQKGFTLIELLAVIVILAIIAVIAVPIILNVIDKAKNGAAEQSAQGYVDAIEKQIMTNQVKNENLIEEGEYTKAELDAKNVQIKGEITDAIVVVGAKGRVTQGRFCIDGFSIDYDGKKATKNTEANYCEEMDSILAPCVYSKGQAFNFEYTGGIQTFAPECNGRYKLEVWGASGGGANHSYNYEYGGHGGYSYGTFTMNDQPTLYVVVGGAGTKNSTSNNSTYAGGYNGGGAGRGAGGGGGATHIGLKTGLLTTFSSDYATQLLLVAGAGGGANAVGGNQNEALGGAGGGTTGIAGRTTSNWGYQSYTSSPGTQSAAGSNTSGWNNNGGFGRGSDYYGDYCAGGGAGFYGGACGAYHGGSGAGGSGYINTTKLTNAETINGEQSFKAPNGNDETGHIGNGYARITYLGK